ncbi:hypothetical protein CBL_06099 [Carabus blaptoides fortunei]
MCTPLFTKWRGLRTPATTAHQERRDILGSSAAVTHRFHCPLMTSAEQRYLGPARAAAVTGTNRTLLDTSARTASCCVVLLDYSTLSAHLYHHPRYVTPETKILIKVFSL